MGQALKRAWRGFREEKGLYFASISSLTVAFLLLGAAALVMSNLGQLRQYWGQHSRLTVYLRDEVSPDQVSQLRLMIDAQPEVREVVFLDKEHARSNFLKQMNNDELAALPAEAFPASLELELARGTASTQTSKLVEQIKAMSMVEDVEAYQGWYSRLYDLLAMGNQIAIALAALVGLCVLAVIRNTIRLALANRKQEVEVLRYCGATRGFVRLPYVIEGFLQGLMGASFAVFALAALYFSLRGPLNAAIFAFAGVSTSFINLWLILGMLVAGSLIGALGSALSVRRYLTV